jgi:flavoprotein
MKWYNLWNDLNEIFPKTSVEHGANSPFIAGQLQTGKFDLFLVCPMSANTAAKIAHGIADSLLTNGVSQAAKARIPIYIYPADQYEGSVTTILPDGKEMTLYMRDVDIENANLLKRMQEITVLESMVMCPISVDHATLSAHTANIRDMATKRFSGYENLQLFKQQNLTPCPLPSTPHTQPQPHQASPSE